MFLSANLRSCCSRGANVDGLLVVVVVDLVVGTVLVVVVGLGVVVVVVEVVVRRVVVLDDDDAAALLLLLDLVGVVTTCSMNAVDGSASSTVQSGSAEIIISK